MDANQPQAAASEDWVISEIILEGMIVGVFESCQVVRPTELGRNIVRPFDPALSKAGDDPEVCREVFTSTQQSALTQERFLFGFLNLLQAGEGAFAALASHLDDPEMVSLTKRMVRYLGVRFATVYCLMALRIQELAVKKKILLVEGMNLRMAM